VLCVCGVSEATLEARCGAVWVWVCLSLFVCLCVALCVRFGLCVCICLSLGTCVSVQCVLFVSL
jgi:hypothetical protein